MTDETHRDSHSRNRPEDAAVWEKRRRALRPEGRRTSLAPRLETSAWSLDNLLQRDEN